MTVAQTPATAAGDSMPQTFPIGTPLRLLVELPGTEDALELRSQVVRAEPSGDRIGVAVMFAPLAPAALSRIDSLLAEKPQV